MLNSKSLKIIEDEEINPINPFVIVIIHQLKYIILMFSWMTLYNKCMYNRDSNPVQANIYGKNF